MLPNECYLPSKPHRCRQWLSNVHEIDSCVLCGAWGIQAAHRNQGKGMSSKADDCLTAALCPACHYELDSGTRYSKEERRAILDDAICRTIAQLARRGLICAQRK